MANGAIAPESEQRWHPNDEEDGEVQNRYRVRYVGSNVLQLTDGVGSEARSSFFATPVYVGAFQATWTYQDIGGGGATSLGSNGARAGIEGNGRRVSDNGPEEVAEVPVARAPAGS